MIIEILEVVGSIFLVGVVAFAVLLGIAFALDFVLGDEPDFSEKSERKP